MSKGTPVITIRIPPGVVQQIDEIAKQSINRKATEPWTRSSWIMQAIVDKLDHVRRGREASKRRRKTPVPPLPAPAEETTTPQAALPVPCPDLSDAVPDITF